MILAIIFRKRLLITIFNKPTIYLETECHNFDFTEAIMTVTMSLNFT